MKRGISTLLLTAMLALPGFALAASHNMDHGSMGHGSMNHDDMMKDAATVMLPEQTVDGITALAHLKDVKATMAKMGMKHTHHFMVNFKDAKSGKALEAQVAAVKIVDPGGKEGAPIELMSMDGHSGADVILPAGTYKFKVAAKLPGEKKVQYEFSANIK